MSDQLTVAVKGTLLGDTDTYYDDLTDRVSSTTFGLSAFGGYTNAQIGFTDNLSIIDGWLQSGLGRDITIYSPALTKVWNGFVNKISVQVAGRSTTIGPLTDLGNQIIASFAPVDTALTLPAVGVTSYSAWGTDAISQGKYGVWQKVVTAGARDPDEIDYLRDLWLAENAYPKTSNQFSQAGGAVSIILECAGYFSALRATIYAMETSGLVDASDKIAAILDADANGLFSSANAAITENVLTVSQYDNSRRTLLDCIQSVVGLGDALSNRWLFGVYGDRVAHYGPAPSEIEYLFYQADGDDVFQTAYAPVEPWGVLPGKWLFDPDFMIGRVATGTPDRQDPRLVFIEDVTVTGPSSMTINGSHLDLLSQKLAQMTMSGGR